MMKSITAEWFECQLRHEATTDGGKKKKVTETYCVEALSFSEAEMRVLALVAKQDPGVAYDVRTMKRAAYKEVFFDDKTEGDLWYTVKMQLITLDDKGKEKRATVTYLVNADSVGEARINVIEAMKGSMIDYAIVSIVETKIVQVLPYTETLAKELGASTEPSTKVQAKEQSTEKQADESKTNANEQRDVDGGGKAGGA